jgi:hypothetical protein
MRDFLEWLYGGHWNSFDSGYQAELRVIGDMGFRTQRFYPMGEWDSLIPDAQKDDAAGLEVYVGVLPRWRPGGTAADTTTYADIVFLDVDGKHNGGKEGALKRILDFAVPPSVIVDSGHGYHCYWKLDRLHRFNEDIEPIIKGLIQHLGGDPGVHDRARILRLPGLSNHKDGGNAPVRLIRFDTTLSYRLSDLTEYAYREPPKPRYNLYGTVNREAAFVFDDFDYDPGKGARSERDFGAICKMIEGNWDDAAIVRAFVDHPQGIGAKTHRQGIRYLERTIRKAHQAVGR